MDILALVAVPDEYIILIDGQTHIKKEFIDLFNKQNQRPKDEPERFDRDVLIDRVLEFARENPTPFKNSQVRSHLEQNGTFPSAGVVTNALSEMGKTGLLVKSGDRSGARWSLPA